MAAPFWQPLRDNLFSWFFAIAIAAMLAIAASVWAALTASHAWALRVEGAALTLLVLVLATAGPAVIRRVILRRRMKRTFADAPKGLLDYQLDSEIALKEYLAVMNRVTKGAQSDTRKIQRYSRSVAWARNASPFWKRYVFNRGCRMYDRSRNRTAALAIDLRRCASMFGESQLELVKRYLREGVPAEAKENLRSSLVGAAESTTGFIEATRRARDVLSTGTGYTQRLNYSIAGLQVALESLCDAAEVAVTACRRTLALLDAGS